LALFIAFTQEPVGELEFFVVMSSKDILYLKPEKAAVVQRLLPSFY